MTIEIRPMTEEEKKEHLLEIPQFIIDLANEPDVKIKPIKTNTIKDHVFTPVKRKRKRTDVHLEIKESISNFINENKVKKVAFIKAITELNTHTTHWIVKRTIRKLFKQRFIAIDKTYKTKPFVIKGHYWRAI